MFHHTCESRTKLEIMVNTLSILSLNGSLTLSEVEEKLNFSISIQNHLCLLLEQGLVSKTIYSEKMPHVYSITQKGINVLEILWKINN